MKTELLIRREQAYVATLNRLAFNHRFLRLRIYIKQLRRSNMVLLQKEVALA